MGLCRLAMIWAHPAGQLEAWHACRGAVPELSGSHTAGRICAPHRSHRSYAVVSSAWQAGCTARSTLPALTQGVTDRLTAFRSAWIHLRSHRALRLAKLCLHWEAA